MASGIHKFTVQEAENAKMGQGGYMHLDEAGGGAGGTGTDNTGAAVAGVEYVSLTVLEAATITTESNDSDTYPDLSAIPVPAGTTIYGRWKKVTLATSDATAIVYRG